MVEKVYYCVGGYGFNILEEVLLNNWGESVFMIIIFVFDRILKYEFYGKLVILLLMFKNFLGYLRIYYFVEFFLIFLFSDIGKFFLLCGF